MRGTFLVIKLITFDNEEKEMVDSLKYIVVGIGTTHNASAASKNRLKITKAAYYKLKRIWTKNQYSRNNKMKMYKINIIYMLLYVGRMLEYNQQ